MRSIGAIVSDVRVRVKVRGIKRNIEFLISVLVGYCGVKGGSGSANYEGTHFRIGSYVAGKCRWVLVCKLVCSTDLEYGVCSPGRIQCRCRLGPV